MSAARRFPVPTVMDDCTPECPALIADIFMSGARAAGARRALFETRGKPVTIVSQKGTEFTSNASYSFAQEGEIDWP